MSPVAPPGMPAVLVFSPRGWDPSREQQQALFAQPVTQGAGEGG